MPLGEKRQRPYTVGMDRLPKFLIAAAFALLGIGANPMHAMAAEGHRVYDPQADAAADMRAALARVEGTDRRVLVSLGANWCHDSRGLAEHFARPEIAPLLAPFEVVYIDVGGRDRNQDFAEHWGLLDPDTGQQVGTPNLVLVDADGHRLNSVEDARGWRRADSKSVEEVADWLREWAP